jgi:6-phosphogluconolactonase
VAAPWTVYVGTYGPAERETLFRLEVDARGGLRVLEGLAGIESPAFLALHPGGSPLYVASERGGADGELWALDRAASGRLTPRGRRPGHGRSTCHVAVDGGGRMLLAANYGGPGIVGYPLEGDGGIGLPAVVLRHAGSGPHPRQRGPHPHSVNVAPSGRFVYVPDLGTDRVHGHRLDAAAGTLTPDDPGAATAPGSGPRHLAFHPHLPCLYVAGELDSTVTVLPWDRGGGALGAPVQRVSTLPAGWEGRSTAAHVQVHPSGTFLYASNRGHDSIAVFRIERDGRLAPAGHAATGGPTPRHFALSPDGTILLAGNQDGGAVVSFRVAAGGGLEPTGQRLELPKPVCILFAP